MGKSAAVQLTLRARIGASSGTTAGAAARWCLPGPHSSDAAVDDAIVRSLLDDDQAEDWQQHKESDYIKKEQNNGDERAAALSGSLDLAQGEVPCSNRYGPPERAKQGEHYCYYC